MADHWEASFDTDGSGNWELVIPPSASREDMLALSPVIDEIREFVKPTIDHAA